MPVTWTKSDKSAKPCPVCNTLPAVEDRATANTRVVTYKCQNGHFSESGKDAHEARSKWTKAVRIYLAQKNRAARAARVVKVRR